MFVVILLVTLVICALVKYILEMYHNESYVQKLKCKQTFIPIFGNALSLLGMTATEIFSDLVKFTTHNETPLKMYIGHRLKIILDKPEDLKAVLTSPHCFDKPYIYGFYPSPRGIITEQYGGLWRQCRRLLNPLFNLKTLQSFIPIFNEKMKNFVDELKMHAGTSGIDMIPYTNTCCLEMLCVTVLGLEIDLKSGKGKEFTESLKEISQITMKRMAMPWAHLDFIYRWTNLYKQQQKHWANIQYLANKVFDKQIKNYAVTESNYSQNSLEQNEYNFIRSYLEGKFSEDVMKQQIEAMFNVNNETTGPTAAYSILMLAMHPHIQDQVFAELRSVFEMQDEDVTYEHIQKLPILERVIKETMRLFPAGPFVERVSSAEVPINNCIIPKNTSITISFFTLHRRMDIWGEHAHEFNPDNFLPENVQSRHPFAFLPFSGGPRNCIGHQYAMFSLKVMLSALLRNYEFSTDSTLSDLEFVFEVTLKLAKKHMVKITPRDW